MVPPIEIPTKIIALQTPQKLYVKLERPMTAIDRTIKTAVTAKIEYHQPAISLREEPPHKRLARYVVVWDSIVL